MMADKRPLSVQRARPGQTGRELEVAAQLSNEPLRGEDLSPTSTRVINTILDERGRNQRASLAERQLGLFDRVEANPTQKNRHDLEGVTRTLESGAIKDIPITPRRATNARTRLFEDAESIMRSRAPELDHQGRPKPQYPEGYGWYFSHRRDLNKIAQDIEYGPEDVPTIGRTRPPASKDMQQRVVNASAVMAAANSPDNEKAAVGAFGEVLRRDQMVRLSPSAQKKMGVDRANVKPSELTSRQIADMTTTAVAPGVEPQPPKDTRRGSTTSRNADAVGFLRGELGEADIPDKFPASSQAKLESYRRNIMEAEPNTGVEDEYFARYQDRANPAQGRLDLFGLKAPQPGILGTRSVEDTWMNAISSGQQLETLPGSKTSPAKNVSSDSQTYSVGKKAEINGETVSDTAPGVQGAAMLHAWNNARTTGAAQALSKESDTQIPSTGVQEVSWIRARQQAGKDAEFAQRQRAVEAEEKTRSQLHGAQFDTYGGGGKKATDRAAKRTLSGDWR